MAPPKKLNLDEPRWDQSTYWGRAKHFFAVTNPLNILASDCELDRAKDIYLNYKKGIVPKDTTDDDLWKAKHLYDSAFHPDTGEKMMLIGRMSAQVPMNMTITGCMMTFYKSTPAVVFWQWMNQSFNAVVNYTNRSGKTPISTEELATSYLLATSGAVGTALTLNSLARKARPIIGRFVPFAAVAAANCINIPLMRRRELSQGVELLDDKGQALGESRKAAVEGISAVVFSRILMASPGMEGWIYRELAEGVTISDVEGHELGQSVSAAAWGISTVVFVRTVMGAPGMALTPLAAAWMEKRCLPSGALFQVLFCGLCLTFATPLCCALFSQRASISVDRLEDGVKSKIKAMKYSPNVVYYNKGL